MITENTHPEHNDWQEPAAERSSASESATPPGMTDAPLTEEQPTSLEVQPGETLAETLADVSPSASDAEQVARPAEPSLVLATGAQNARPEQESLPGTDEISPAAASPTAAEQPASQAPETEPTVITGAEMIRPFSDFIEEFRQTEVRFNALLQDQEATFTTFAAEGGETTVLLEMTGESAQTAGEAPVIEEHEQASKTGSETLSAPSSLLEEIQSGPTQPAPPAERPVSPLLRPATRVRLPRHGRHRVEEIVKPIEPPVEPAKAVVENPVEAEPAAKTPQAEEAARPARRYRFDRPAATTGASPSIAKPAAPQAPLRSSDPKEKRPGHTENKPSAEPVSKPAATIATPAEISTSKSSVQETPPASVEVSAPSPTSNERRRRGNHDRQREKEQVAPAAEVPAPEPEPAPEMPVEDLPPLEYSELQAANSRRRRRRRVGSASTIAASNGAVPKGMFPEPASPSTTPPGSAVALPRSASSALVTPPTTQNYNIVSGYTVSQMNQGNDNSGPFMGPEPSPARGSTFTAQPQLRHARNEALRSAPLHAVKHSESPLMSAASVNHLGNMVAQAIQTQTDRMVSELRRANQVPTNISVSLPPFPSNERVGVFVDVANLLYSARTLRLTVDFGKLLDFLRGNRRLVRAQAYCPTSPQPGDDQMFLQAVKGLGYRITTKNYKTFSSGAKKADLDLDLCMDVVRLVDGKAVDCIVLVSGDSDFMPMLDYCSDHGVRVEVAAFDESMSATLRQACDLFVNLSMLEEIRA